MPGELLFQELSNPAPIGGPMLILETGVYHVKETCALFLASYHIQRLLEAQRLLETGVYHFKDPALILSASSQTWHLLEGALIGDPAPIRGNTVLALIRTRQLLTTL